jgi:hypothetical protein
VNAAGCLMFYLSPGCGGKQGQKAGLPVPELAISSPLQTFPVCDAEGDEVRKPRIWFLGNTPRNVVNCPGSEDAKALGAGCV